MITPRRGGLKFYPFLGFPSFFYLSGPVMNRRELLSINGISSPSRARRNPFTFFALHPLPLFCLPPGLPSSSRDRESRPTLRSTPPFSPQRLSDVNLDFSRFYFSPPLFLGRFLSSCLRAWYGVPWEGSFRAIPLGLGPPSCSLFQFPLSWYNGCYPPPWSFFRRTLGMYCGETSFALFQIELNSQFPTPFFHTSPP